MWPITKGCGKLRLLTFETRTASACRWASVKREQLFAERARHSVQDWVLIGPLSLGTALHSSKTITSPFDRAVLQVLHGLRSTAVVSCRIACLFAVTTCEKYKSVRMSTGKEGDQRIRSEVERTNLAMSLLTPLVAGHSQLLTLLA
jgi:hypothetical protein